MSDSLNVCVACGHGPHTGKDCRGGDLMLCGCKNYINAGVALVRSSITTTNLSQDLFPKMLSIGVDIVEILMEAFPEAAARVDAKRKKMQEEWKEQENERQDPDPASGTNQTS